MAKETTGETAAMTKTVTSVIHEKDRDAVIARLGKIPEGVEVVTEEVYNRIALEGGFFDPVNDPGNRPPLDLSSLRVLAEDSKADAAKRKDAQERLARIQKGGR